MCPNAGEFGLCYVERFRGLDGCWLITSCAIRWVFGVEL